MPHVRGDEPLLPAVTVLDTAAHGFDAAGNKILQRKPRYVYSHFDGVGDAYEWSDEGSVNDYHAYDAQQRLRMSVHSVDGAPRRQTQLDYAYDALGRRITVRTRADSVSCQNPAYALVPPCALTKSSTIRLRDPTRVINRPTAERKITEEIKRGIESRNPQ